MQHYIADKVIIITGGSSGFGLETARILLGLGAKVIITGRNQERLDAAAKSLDSENLRAVRADACVTDDWKSLVRQTTERFGRIDVLVNNHGAGMKIALTEEMTDEDINEIMDVNIHSVIRGCREVIPTMRGQGNGHIVNVSSACAHRGWACWGVYTAAKAGMVGFTRVLHREMCDWGGKATNFIPGAAKTNFCDAAGIDDSWLEGYPTAEDFARSLVQVIDVPESCVVEEVRVWGTKQIADMLDPY